MPISDQRRKAVELLHIVEDYLTGEGWKNTSYLRLRTNDMIWRRGDEEMLVPLYDFTFKSIVAFAVATFHAANEADPAIDRLHAVERRLRAEDLFNEKYVFPEMEKQFDVPA